MNAFRRLAGAALASAALLAAGPSPVAAQEAPAPPVGASAGRPTLVMVRVRPGQPWAEAISQASPEQDLVVLIEPGVHPRQSFANVHPRGEVAFESADPARRAVVQGLTVTGSDRLTFRSLDVVSPGGDSQGAVRIYNASNRITLDGLSVRTAASATGVEIFDRAHDITVRGSRIDGSAARGDGVRNIWIGSPDVPSSGWVRNVVVEGNDLGGAPDDAIHISGGVSIAIRRNNIHDVQVNSGHNDGIQVVAGDDIRIEANLLTSPGSAGPDQGIILGHAKPASANRRVSHVVVINNRINRWRGSGINVAGVDGIDLIHNTFTGNALPDYVNDANGFTNTGVRVLNNVSDDLRLSGGGIVEAAGNCVRAGDGGRVVPDLGLDENLRLRAGSPCRGAGVTAAGLPATDANDEPRDAADPGALATARTPTEVAGEVIEAEPAPEADEVVVDPTTPVPAEAVPVAPTAEEVAAGQVPLPAGATEDGAAAAPAVPGAVARAPRVPGTAGQASGLLVAAAVALIAVNVAGQASALRRRTAPGR